MGRVLLKAGLFQYTIWKDYITQKQSIVNGSPVACGPPEIYLGYLILVAGSPT